MILRAKAPLRISFCGGGTDVSPYPEEKGGVVLSTTIDKYVHATLRPRDDRSVVLTSLDYDVTEAFPLDTQLPIDGKLDLLKGVVNRFRALAPRGFDLLVHSDAPPGSGLGSSSTLVTTLVGLLREWVREPLTNYEIAELTYKIEREDLRIAGGRQDQYAATFGGFNFIEFHRDHTIVNPLRIRPGVVNELEYSMLLCYTGATRVSAHIVENQMRSYVAGKGAVVQSLDRMKELATPPRSGPPFRRASPRGVGLEKGPRPRDHERAYRPPLRAGLRLRCDRGEDPRRGRGRLPPHLHTVRSEADDHSLPRSGGREVRSLRVRGAWAPDLVCDR
jgi:D-glycero-alpha-D-manno-heptose-7-phosphate kinase